MAYDNETYLKSLAASSGDISRQVSNALTEIGTQKASAQEAAGRIAPTVGGILDESKGQLGGDLQSLGLQTSPALQAFYTNGKQSAGLVGSLMQQGFGEQATRRQGSVQGLQGDLLSNIRMQAMEYRARREQEDRQLAFEREMQAAEFAEAERIRNQEIWDAAIAEALRNPVPPVTDLDMRKARYADMKARQADER